MNYMPQPLIIAIGNGACYIADGIQSQGLEGAKFAFLDTEPDDLNNHSSVGETVLLQGTEQERHVAINHLLAADVGKVVVIACLGGRTGSYYASLSARLAKLAGKSLVCAVTLPFDFEGTRCNVLANESLGVIKECTPDVLVFDNKELNAKHPDLGIIDAFNMVDKQVAESLRTIFISWLG